VFNRRQSIAVSGSAHQIQISGIPDNVQMDPVLPFTETEIKIQLINKEKSHPLVIFSRDYDRNILNVLGDKPFVNIDITEKNISEQRREENVETNTSLNIILYGPPYSGKTTVGKELSKLYNIPIININKMLQGMDSISSESNLSDNLKILISKYLEPLKTGFIVDGLDNRYNVTPSELLVEIVKALGPQNKCFMFFLSQIEPNIIREREIELEQQEKRFERELFSDIAELTEQEYSRLTPNERAIHDQEWAKYKKYKQDIIEKRRTEREAEKAKENPKFNDPNEKTKLKIKKPMKKAKNERKKDEDPARNLEVDSKLVLGEHLQMLYDNHISGMETLLDLFKEHEISDAKKILKCQGIQEENLKFSCTLFNEYSSLGVYDIVGTKSISIICQSISKELPLSRTMKETVTDSLPIPPNTLEEVLKQYNPGKRISKAFTLVSFSESEEEYRAKVVDKKEISIRFCPTKVGTYDSIFSFGVVGCNTVGFNILITGFRHKN
jgi:adenylate kinase family enzyme